MKVTEGILDGRGLKIGLVASRFNETVVRQLVEGAGRTLRQHGVEEQDIELIWVPGSVEIPVAVAELLERGGCDAVVALGAVIRGDTPHFDYVAEAASSGIASSSGSSHPRPSSVATRDARLYV